MDAERLHGLFGLEGRRAVVTGGSRGVGYMIADGLLDAGCDVIISARSEAQLSLAVETLAPKGSVEAIAADLSTDEGLTYLHGEIERRWDRLDILCNNAGATWGSAIDEFPGSGWDKVMTLNVRGPFFLTQKLLPLLRAAASPGSPARIINTSSVHSLDPPNMETYSYTSSKAALNMLTRHLAKRLAAEHITVNAIAPGPFDSEMMAFALDDPVMRASIAKRVPVGRIGEPDDLAGVAIYLAGQAGSFLTGVTIPVAGGLGTA